MIVNVGLENRGEQKKLVRRVERPVLMKYENIQLEEIK